MKLRRTLIAAALAVAATTGMTVPLAAPALAASCTEVRSASGSSARLDRSHTEFSVSSTLNIGVADCAGWRYRYTVYVFEGQKIYGSASVTGTNSWGITTPPTVHTSGLESGNTQVGFGYKTEYYDFGAGTWTTANKHAWYIQLPGKFNTSSGENVTPYPYSDGSKGCYQYAYSEPCLPFF